MEDALRVGVDKPNYPPAAATGVGSRVRLARSILAILNECNRLEFANSSHTQIRAIVFFASEKTLRQPKFLRE